MAIATGTAMLVGAGIAGATQLASGHSASNAARDAATVESKYTAEALADARAEREYQRTLDERNRNDAIETRDYNRAQYGDYVGRLSPYANAGTKAVTRLSNNLGGNLASVVPSNGNGMVNLADKHGRVRPVPAAQAEKYIALGARKV
jgi:hypothetical protein